MAASCSGLRTIGAISNASRPRDSFEVAADPPIRAIVVAYGRIDVELPGRRRSGQSDHPIRDRWGSIRVRKTSQLIARLDQLERNYLALDLLAAAQDPIGAFQDRVGRQAVPEIR